MSAPEHLSCEHNRRLLLAAQGLTVRGGGPGTLLEVIRSLGFVQLDSINVVERAHHLTLRSRLAKYQPEWLAELLEHRQIFEHWTHDAALLPMEFLSYWRYRATLYPEWMQRQAWWRERIGPQPEKLFQRVLDQVRERGPVTSRDFASHIKSGTWWGWKPEKAALEYLWRRGDLAICSRQGFVKVYDLAERVFAEVTLPNEQQYLDWAFSQALDRLGAATPRELADFWGGLSAQQAALWGVQACRDGRAVPVDIEAAGPGLAVPDWKARSESIRLPGQVRLLNPFDPMVRDRKRLKRLFGFEYSFEAYVPGPKRVHGYYVLPVLEKERFVARLDAKMHRDRKLLEVRGLWWEPGIRVTEARQVSLGRALERLAQGLGATSTQIFPIS